MASTSKTIAELISSDLSVDVANTDIVGTITETQIADAAVTAAKLDTTYLTPTGDGSGLSGISGGMGNITCFTSPGQWTAPPSTACAKVTVVGGGGGAGFGCRTQDGEEWSPSPGGSGGGGGTAIEYVPIQGGSPYPVTVGAGGGQASSGGTSSFSTFVSSTGGSGGQNACIAPLPCRNNRAAPGNGGKGSGGTVNTRGLAGDTVVDGFGRYKGGNSCVTPSGTVNYPSNHGGGSSFGGFDLANPVSTAASCICRASCAGCNFGGGASAGQAGACNSQNLLISGASGSGGIVLIEY